MDPTPELAKKLEQDKREAAAAMTCEERALGGVIMFDILIDAMRGVLHVQFPGSDTATIEQIVIDRLRKMRDNETIA